MVLHAVESVSLNYGQSLLYMVFVLSAIYHPIELFNCGVWLLNHFSFGYVLLIRIMLFIQCHAEEVACVENVDLVRWQLSIVGKFIRYHI